MNSEENKPVFDTQSLEEMKQLLQSEKAEPQQPKQSAPAAKKEKPARETEEEEKLSPACEAYGMLHDWVYVLAVLTVIFVFFFRLVGVDGSSMYPTLVDHDYLVL